jgi:hypothetical protein
MSTLEEVKAAQARMDKAKDALQKYLDRSATQPSDRDLHRRLAERLKRAADEYFTLVIELRP